MHCDDIHKTKSQNCLPLHTIYINKKVDLYYVVVVPCYTSFYHVDFINKTYMRWKTETKTYMLCNI